MFKKIGVIILIMAALLLLLPLLIVRGCQVKNPPEIEGEPFILKVWDHRAEKLISLPLGEYLAGVVAAEMPASLDLEALKAQAIVARTYTLARLRASGGSGCDRHPEADICTDSAHCQAWVSQEAAMANWPFFRQRANWRKILRAVAETQGQVITYAGKLIDAVYHSTCGGSTENSEDVWTNVIPYLRRVECGYCQDSPRYTETIELKAEQVAEKLGVSAERLKITVLERTDHGRIIAVDTGQQVLRGLEFRSRLGLRSAKISWLQQGNKYSFTCVGYGHGVGLCQYGADGMAKDGHKAVDIINKYYFGVQVVRAQVGE